VPVTHKGTARAGASLPSRTSAAKCDLALACDAFWGFDAEEYGKRFPVDAFLHGKVKTRVSGKVSDERDRDDIARLLNCPRDTRHHQVVKRSEYCAHAAEEHEQERGGGF